MLTLSFSPVVNLLLKFKAMSLAGAATSIIFVASFVAIKVCLSAKPLSRQKYFVAKKSLSGQRFCVLSRQTRVCRDKSMPVARKSFVFVATKLCLFRQIFVLFRQTRVCRDKSMLVAIKSFVWQQNVLSFVPTKTRLSRQKNACRDKKKNCRDKIMFVPTKFCREKRLNIFLSR